MPFTTEIALSAPLDERRGSWKTLQPLNFRSEKFQKHFVVPAGFESDLASVPRVPIVYWLVGGRGAAAAVLHDWLYRNGVRFNQIGKRVEADQVYFEALVDTRVPLYCCWAMFAGVRLGGRKAFRGGKGKYP